jgi:glucose/arabinose dehydrogenase
MPNPSPVRVAAILAASLVLPASAGAQSGHAEQRIETALYDVRVETVASGLEHPWSLVFLPDGAMLVTERPGAIRLVTADGRVSDPLAGTPPVAAVNQGGMLDIALDPDFEANGLVYMAYAEERDGGIALSVARAVFDREAEAFDAPEVIFRQLPAVSGGRHLGARLVFHPDGTLFITAGDRGVHSDESQEPGNHIGAIMRINPDGSIPPGNPHEMMQGWAPEIWSIGHRNVQGATMRPGTVQFWTHEHGARGGDEVNLIEPGLNYGWPVIAYGVHYTGGQIGVGTHKEGMEQPVYYWDPALAPSGMAFYDGEAFPQWQGDLFIGGLVSRVVSRLTLAGDSVIAEERILGELGERIRDVRNGPDGALYLLTDAANGRILRVIPAP